MIFFFFEQFDLLSALKHYAKKAQWYSLSSMSYWQHKFFLFLSLQVWIYIVQFLI